MRTISDDYKIQFYRYLSGDSSVSDLENFIYRQSDLERQLDDETYFNLINFNFKDKKTNKLEEFLLGRIIDEGQFETWKLKTILSNFLTDTTKVDRYLDQLYHLYCGVYQNNGERKYAFKFLGNLGLNYFWWLEEGYLKTTYGENWKTEYEKGIEDFEFYHKQFQPFANEILSALDDNRIQILNDGTYLITEDLKLKLETDTIFNLKHKDRQ